MENNNPEVLLQIEDLCQYFGSTKAVNTIQSVKFNIDVDDKIFEISNY